MESKYSNKFINKEDSDLYQLEPFNKEDYINIINYETHSFTKRKNNLQEDDELDQYGKLDEPEPQIYLLKSIIKSELEKSNNNISSVVGLDQFYQTKPNESVDIQNGKNQYPSILKQFAKRGSFNSYKTITGNRIKSKKKNTKPAPLKIWIEEYNNNERKKYTTYINNDKVTSPFQKSEEVEKVVESTISYEEQITKPNNFYNEPLMKVPVDDDGKKIIMAKRNFPVYFPMLQWKSKTDTSKHVTPTNHTTKEYYTPYKHVTKITTVKSVMDKLNEINLDDNCLPKTKKTTTASTNTTTTTTKGNDHITKKYTEILCGTDIETPFTEHTTLRTCKNYTGTIHCPNCKKKIRYNMEVIRNMPPAITAHSKLICTC